MKVRPVTGRGCGHRQTLHLASALATWGAASLKHSVAGDQVLAGSAADDGPRQWAPDIGTCTAWRSSDRPSV